MDCQVFIRALWDNIARQDAEGMRRFFTKDAVINWHNTNECFTLEEYITANCKYPGDWRGQVERIERTEGRIVSAAKVWLADESASFHCVSFYRLVGERISQADEYWGDDGAPPQWRREMQIGKGGSNVRP